MRLGIMGGTFDPVHIGHMQIARSAIQEAGLDHVLFLPDGDPPHKTPYASGTDRLMMLRLAIDGEPAFSVSDMELNRPGRTYTVDTLLELKREDPASELFYIIGSDTLYQFPAWKTAQQVAQLCKMLVVLRPGRFLEDVRQEQRRLFAEFGLCSLLLSQTGPDISSSRVRQAVGKGEDIRSLMPSRVFGYIIEKNLYRPKTI